MISSTFRKRNPKKTNCHNTHYSSFAATWTLVFLVSCNSFAGVQVCDAFGSSNGHPGRCSRAATRSGRTRSSTTPLRSSTNSNGNDNDNDNGNNDTAGGGSYYWKLPNDFSMFLTQRSIQSFMFLTSQLRDPETCYWVEDFTKANLVQLLDNNKADFSLSEELPNLGEVASRTDWRPDEGRDDGDGSGGDSSSEETETEGDRRTCHLLRYHGLAAMDTGRFPTWEAYFEEMLEQPTDSWIIASEQKHIPDYTWEIDPSSLCSRILSVREQLSREFAKDLQAVSDMGGQTFDWYWERLRKSRDDKEQEGQSETNDGHNDGGATTPLTDPSSLRGSRENLLFLEINVDDPTLDHKPSPLRRSNFDLLVLLATEEAIHRVLNRWESKKTKGDLWGSESVSLGFLENFYQERQHFFHGPLPSYGKADDLLEELLSSALRFKAEDGDGGDSSVINPTRIAELVLEEREQVALDWKEIASEAPQHHMKIQKLRLSKMMRGNSQGEASENDGNNNNNQRTDGSGRAEHGGFDPGPGAFE